MQNNQTVKEIIGKLELTSDLFFSVVLEDVEVCQEVVQILTNRVLEILEVKCQFTIISLTNHSIRLDILAREVSDCKIGVEMHPQSNEDRVKRTRYNVGSIDVQTLKAGQKYQDLPDILHIYITKADFLKTKKGINCIKRSVKGTDVEVPNGVEEYYISLTCEGDTPEQTALMEYMLDSNAITESTIFPKLVKRVRYLKENKGGNEIMCEIMDELLRQEREAVLAEVQVEVDKAKVEMDKTKEILTKGVAELLLEMNFSSDEVVKKIMDKLHLNEGEVRRYLTS